MIRRWERWERRRDTLVAVGITHESHHSVSTHATAGSCFYYAIINPGTLSFLW